MSFQLVKPNTDLVNEINKKQIELIKLVESHYGTKTAPRTYISYELKSANILGSHQIKILDGETVHYIKLNPYLLNELKQQYISEVFVHEYAHACVHKYCRGSGKKIMPHGKEFKKFCSLFGISDSATSKVANNLTQFSENSTKPMFAYSCDCKTHYLSKTRHNKSQKNGILYRCKNCSAILSYTPEKNQPVKTKEM